MDSGWDVDCVAEVVPSQLVVLDAVLDPTVDVPRSAAEEAVSAAVLVMGKAVVRDGVLVSRVELSGRAEVVAEICLSTGAEVDVWSRTVVLAVVVSVAALVTC